MALREAVKTIKKGDYIYNQFDYVTHTSHINSAINILKAGEIKQSLVFDESRLNTKRILVSWFSPNEWHTGYRYGNIRFNFNFSDLIANKKYYWVEVGHYQIPAPRILITDTDNDYHLERYDPTFKDGCYWWYNAENNVHYYRNDACLEVMIESSVSLEKVSQIDFVDHHTKYCSINRMTPQNCSELGMNRFIAAGKFLAAAISSNTQLKSFENLFKRNFELSYHSLIKFADEADFDGDLDSLNDLSESFVVAFSNAIATDRPESAIKIANLFNDIKEFYKAVGNYCNNNYSDTHFKNIIERVTR